MTLSLVAKCYIDGLVHDCSNAIANALELLQSCTKPSIYSVTMRDTGYGFSHEFTYDTPELTRDGEYRKVSNIRCTKFQNLSVSHLGLQLSLSNKLKPSVQWRMKM